MLSVFHQSAPQWPSPPLRCRVWMTLCPTTGWTKVSWKIVWAQRPKFLSLLRRPPLTVTGEMCYVLCWLKLTHRVAKSSPRSERLSGSLVPVMRKTEETQWCRGSRTNLIPMTRSPASLSQEGSCSAKVSQWPVTKRRQCQPILLSHTAKMLTASLNWNRKLLLSGKFFVFLVVLQCSYFLLFCQCTKAYELLTVDLLL